MFAFTLLNWLAEVEGPDTTLQPPVPFAGTLAASTMDALLHTVRSTPALEALAGAIEWIVTSSVEGAQGAAETDHRKT